MLEPKENNTTHFDLVDESNISNRNPFTVSDNNTTETQNQTKTQNNLRKRPPAVPNHFPENQTVFSKKRTVPGTRTYSETVKSKMNSQSIKIFSDSMQKVQK